jgi:cell division septum initiation protein DivIVA
MSAEPDRQPEPEHGFAIVLRGYRPVQVDQALAELRAQVGALGFDRDGLVGRNQQLAGRLASAIRRANALEAQVKHLSASAGSADGLSERVRTILELASDEANAMTARARELLEQTRTSRAELDHHLAELDAERNRVLAAAWTDADQARQRALSAASALRADAQAESDRILGEARTTAANVVAEAYRAAVADVDRLREHILAELPRSLNAVVNDAIRQLPRNTEEPSTISEAAAAVVVPEQRKPSQREPLQTVPSHGHP